MKDIEVDTNQDATKFPADAYSIIQVKERDLVG